MAILDDRSALTTPADGDLYMTTDVSDTTDAATGTDKKITWANIKAGIKSYYDSVISTLTNKTIDLTDNTLTGTKAQFDTAVSDGNIAYDGGAHHDGFSDYVAGEHFLQSAITTVGTLSAGNADAVVTDASSTAKGKVELATATELLAETDTGRAVTPSSMSAYAGGTNITTLGTVSAGVWNGTAVDGAYVDIEGTEIKSTGVTGTANYLRVDGDGTCSWQPVAGGSGISAVVVDTTPQLGGTLDCNGFGFTDVQSIAVDMTPDADHTSTGFIHSNLSAGEALSAFEAVYLDGNSRWKKTDASATGTAEKLIGIATVSAAASAAVSVALPNSYIRDDTWAWTPGAAIVLSETAGDLTETAPTATDSVVRVVGYAVNADTIYLNPQQGVVNA